MTMVLTLAVVVILGLLYFNIQCRSYRKEIKRIDEEMSERLKRKRPRRTVF